MTDVQIQLEDELLPLLRQSNQTVPNAARELIILELYRRGAISSGKGAQLLNMSRKNFIQYTARLGIPFYEMTPDEWAEERRQAQSL